MRQWFLASEDREPDRKYLFYTERSDVVVTEGQPLPLESVLAHLGELPKRDWTVRVDLGRSHGESISSLLDGLKALDVGFEPKDTHEMEGRPGFIAVIDMLVQMASTD